MHTNAFTPGNAAMVLIDHHQFFGKLIRRVGGLVRKVARSPITRALGGALRGVAKTPPAPSPSRSASPGPR